MSVFQRQFQSQRPCHCRTLRRTDGFDPLVGFSNDNLYIQLGASVRGRKVFIVQSLSPPVNDHLMELLMMIDIASSAGAREVQAIIPYYSFCPFGQERCAANFNTARLVADLLVTAGATHVMTMMMLHSPQVHGFLAYPLIR